MNKEVRVRNRKSYGLLVVSHPLGKELSPEEERQGFSLDVSRERKKYKNRRIN